MSSVRPSVAIGCIVAKRCGIGPRLLLITNRKSHKPFQMRGKTSTLDDLEGQYCNRNCIGCSASFLATAGLFGFIACRATNLQQVVQFH